ncbi:MAG: serine/threonine protein kinase [Planctomycetota bacterium]|nr:serine/threonine protein kinase [Planctomycetota bacterium]
MADPVGQTIAGYPIEKPLDRGAYDLLYQAQTSAQPLAVKLLRDDLRTDAALASQIMAGWEKTRPVVHSNLVVAYSCGQDASFGPYCIEEVVKSRTLRKLVLDGTKIAWRDAMEIATQLATAVKALHDAGVTHGDIHPGAILITLDQDVKLEGAGTLSAVTRPLPGIQTGAAAGYSAPERLRGAAATPASDVYGIGASLFFLLAGRDLFPGGDTHAVAKAAIEKPPTPLATLAPELAPGVAEFVERMLAKNPAARYANADEVLADLNNLRAGKPLSPPKAAPAAAPKKSSPSLAGIAPSAPDTVIKAETSLMSNPASARKGSSAALPKPGSSAALPRPGAAGRLENRASGLRPGVIGNDPRRSGMGFASGLNPSVSPSESGRLRATGAAVFGKLETQVGSTIPQSEAERQGDDLFRRGQLALAMRSWQEGWDKGNQHAGLRAKLDMGQRELRKSQYQTSINEAKWCFEAGQYNAAVERAQEALTFADSDVQRSESKLLIDMAKAKEVEVSKKRSTNKIVIGVVAFLAVLGGMIYFLVFAGK